METITIGVKGMTCGGCVASVQRVLKAVDGVGTAEVSLERAQAKVEFDPARVREEDLRAAIEDAGFEAA